jgi:small-conductance mechanosensitive channel
VQGLSRVGDFCLVFGNRRINEVIGIRYDDIAKIPAIITEVEAMLKAHKEIDQSQALRVYFNYFNASSLDCNIVAFTKTTSKDKYQQVKQKILLNIADIITKHKAEIAYPTQTLHITFQFLGKKYQYLRLYRLKHHLTYLVIDVESVVQKSYPHRGLVLR